MTALRQELFDVIKILPEENISSALNYIREKFLTQINSDITGTAIKLNVSGKLKKIFLTSIGIFYLTRRKKFFKIAS